MKWELVCSVDGVDVDYETIIESEKEPGFWECYEIAEEHGCELWSLCPLEDEGSENLTA